MSQRPSQESTNKGYLEAPELNLTYMRCPLKGHNNLELKFVSKKGIPKHQASLLSGMCNRNRKTR